MTTTLGSGPYRARPARLSEPARALIVGHRRDAHVVAVVEALASASAPAPMVIDAPALRTEGFSVTLDRLRHADDEITLHGGFGWLRRYAPTEWGIGSVAGSLDTAARRAFLHLVGSVSRLGSRRWLTELSPLLHAEDRLVQLEACRALGLPSPETIVTSNGEEALSVIGPSFVVKPFVGGYYVTPQGDARAVFTSQVDPKELKSLDFAHAPFLAQRLVPANAHLRVVTVGERAWTAVLDARDRPLDWRAQEEAHTAWAALNDEPTEQLALRLATYLNLGYSSQDWILSDDGPWFIDLNPGGQWLFLPDEIASSVTTAIATFLVGS
jgi:hypothetical protein